MRKGLLVGLVVLAAPLDAAAFEPNVLAGYGIIGGNQYAQGEIRMMATVNVSNFFRLGDSWSVGGAGLALRASYSAHRHWDELGLAIPLVTLRRGRAVGQLGVEVQRWDMGKNFYYLAFGIALKGHKFDPREDESEPDRAPRPAPVLATSRMAPSRR